MATGTRERGFSDDIRFQHENNSRRSQWSKYALHNDVIVHCLMMSLFTQTVLHRVPIHQIACCCYVNDDDQHLLFIRAGDSGPATCPVHVMTVDRRVSE